MVDRVAQVVEAVVDGDLVLPGGELIGDGRWSRIDSWRDLESRKLTQQVILTGVCRALNISPIDLASNRRNPTLTAGRDIAVFMLRNYCQDTLSFPAAARLIGYSSHTGALEANNRAISRLREDQMGYRDTLYAALAWGNRPSVRRAE
jgi:hypothetical protein